MSSYVRSLHLLLALTALGGVSHLDHLSHALPAPPVRIASTSFRLPPIPNRGAPGNRRGGASRSDSCVPAAGQLLLPTQTPQSPLLPDAPPVAQDLAALVPIYKTSAGRSTPQDRFHVWGLTSVDRPTFWINVPVTDEFYTAEFSLQNEQDEPLYRGLITLPQTAGVIGVRLPSQVAALEPGKMYHWYFKLKAKCDPKAKTLTFVDGWVQRTVLESAIAQQMQQATATQQAALYAKLGIWYDAVTTLAELAATRSQPASAATDWATLMQAAGLEQLAAVPIVPLAQPHP